MRVTEITVGLSVKKQVKQYEPLDATVFLKAQVDYDEDLTEAHRALEDLATAMVEAQLIRQVAQFKG